MFFDEDDVGLINPELYHVVRREIRKFFRTHTLSRLNISLRDGYVLFLFQLPLLQI